MIHKDQVAEIYNEFFNTTTKNPLINLRYACEALDLDESEAMNVIKGYLFSVRTEILTNPVGFKLLHIYAIERGTRMNTNQNLKGEN